MKLEQTPVVPVFQPVTITLESQAEVDYFASLLGATNTAYDDAFGVPSDMSYELYNKLERIASYSRRKAMTIVLKGI